MDECNEFSFDFAATTEVSLRAIVFDYFIDIDTMLCSTSALSHICLFLTFSINSPMSPYTPGSVSSVPSPTSSSNVGSYHPPPPSMRMADNHHHRGGHPFAGHHSQPPQQFQHQQSPPLQQQQAQNQQQQGPFQQTPIRAHHHPPAVHQMYSANGDAYTYNPNSNNKKQQQKQIPSPQQQHNFKQQQQLYDPSFQQNQQVFVDDNGDPLQQGGGRQPLYANAPPKPRRLNSSSGIDDEGRPTGGSQDVENADDDGGFEEHKYYQGGVDSRHPNAAGVMATATYRQPQGANTAMVVDDRAHFAGNPMQQQHHSTNQQNRANVQPNQQYPPQNRQRYTIYIYTKSIGKFILVQFQIIVVF